MEWAFLLAPSVSVVLALAVSYANNQKTVVRIEEKLSNLSDDFSRLERKVEKHNNVVERVTVLETEIKSAFHTIDDLRSELRG